MLAGLAVRRAGAGPFRVTDYEIRVALSGEADDSSEQPAFAWSSRTARRALGLAAVRLLVTGRARSPVEAVETRLSESSRWVREGSPGITQLDRWVATLPPAGRTAVSAEAVTWATRLWSGIDWSALGSPPTIGRDRWWDSPHSALLALRGRAEVRTDRRQPRGAVRAPPRLGASRALPGDPRRIAPRPGRCRPGPGGRVVARLRPPRTGRSRTGGAHPGCRGGGSRAGRNGRTQTQPPPERASRVLYRWLPHGNARGHQERRHRGPRRPRQDDAGRRHVAPDRRLRSARGADRPGHGLGRPGAGEGHHDPGQEHGRALGRGEAQHRRHPGPRRLRGRGRARPDHGRRRAPPRRRVGGAAAPDPLRAAQGARGPAPRRRRGQQGRPGRRPHRRGGPPDRGALLGPRCRRGPDRLPDPLRQRQGGLGERRARRRGRRTSSRSSGPSSSTSLRRRSTTTRRPRRWCATCRPRPTWGGWPSAGSTTARWSRAPRWAGADSTARSRRPRSPSST